MLELSAIHAGYQEPVLRGISFKIAAGTVVGIVGPSGGGKSTLLRIIAGMQQPGSGQVFWKSEKVKGPNDQLIPGHPDIQLVNQDFALDLYHTVAENVVQKILYLPRDVRDRFTQELLELAELQHHAGKKAILLSGGEQQRLSIIRALAAEPEVLLLDEPFAHLDMPLKERIGDYIKQLCKVRGMTCILVSHEGQDVLQWSNEIHFLDGGEIRRSASPLAFYASPSSAEEARYFGEINEVMLEGKPVLFRPNEYEIVQESPQLQVEIIASLFAGYYWRNLACTKQGEKLVLFASEPLKNISGISIRK